MCGVCGVLCCRVTLNLCVYVYILGPLSEAHGSVVIGICGCVTSDLEAGFVVKDIDALSHDLGSFVIDVRNTGSLHRASVSTVFTDGDNFDTGLEHFDDHIEVDIGLVITPAGIKDIIDFDGVGLGNFLKVIFGGDNHIEAVVVMVTVDITLAVDLVDGEG